MTTKAINLARMKKLEERKEANDQQPTVILFAAVSPDGSRSVDVAHVHVSPGKWLCMTRNEGETEEDFSDRCGAASAPLVISTVS